MTALGAARYIERAGALALALGVAVAMSAQPAVAHAGRGQRAAITPTGVGLLPRIGTKMPAGSAHDSEEMSAPDPAPASGGLVGAISALLVALRRRPSSSTSSRSAPGLSLMELLRSLFGLPDRSPAPVTASGVVNSTVTPVQTVAGVGPVRDIAMSPDGRYAYVAASRPDRSSGTDAWTIKVVDTEANVVVKTIDDLADVIPTSLAASPDSSRLYVADRNDAAIRVIDIREGSPTRNRVVDSLHLEGSLPVGYGIPAAISLSPNGSRLYALMTESGSNPAVLIVDLETRMLAGTVSGGDSIAMFSAGERIYVCADDRLGHTDVTAGVVILDADTGQELGSFGLNDAPAFIRQPILAGSSGQLYLDIDDLDGRLEVLDTSTLNVVARIRIDASADRQLRSIPAAAVLSPDGRCLYVANQGVRLSSDEATEVGWVSVVDTRLNKVIYDIALPGAGFDECQGANPQFIAISPAGDRLVVVNEYGIASIIDIASKSVVGTATLGLPTDQPRLVVVNPARDAIYVGTTGEAGLTVIPL
jgi:DNA-binding beta-propeller fold protein YncE